MVSMTSSYTTTLKRSLDLSRPMASSTACSASVRRPLAMDP